jgi:hypothetical protein
MTTEKANMEDSRNYLNLKSTVVIAEEDKEDK